MPCELNTWIVRHIRRGCEPKKVSPLEVHGSLQHAKIAKNII